MELQFSRKLGVFLPCALMDLAELEDRAAIVRVHGGVMPPSFFHGEPTFSQRRHEEPAAKEAMAKIAAALVAGACVGLC